MALHDRLTEGVGGMNNGSTSNDITTYYETVPSNYLETMLWIESDRMGFLLDSLDLAKLNAQRDIVKNERRQRVDNQPYGRVYEILSKATYPASHPYSWPVDRQHGRSVGGVGGGREELLPAVLRAEQRLSDDRRRFRSGPGEGVGHEVLRRHSARQRHHASHGRAGDAAIPAAPGLRRSRAGAARLHPVADGRRKERRPLRARPCSAPFSPARARRG